MKRCTTCKQTLPLDRFHKNRHQPGGLATECKQCKKAYGEKYRKKNPQQLKRYGLTREQLDALGNNCHLCGVSGDERKMCVDHCHETGRVRGLLCGRCNTALGVLGDNVSGLLRAIEYMGKTAE